MRSVTPSRHISVPTWSRTRTRALGEPCAIRYTIGTIHNQSRRLDSHQHHAVYKTAALLFGHVGISRSAGVEPRARLWRPLALPGAHSCIGPRPCDRGPWRNNYSRSVTFQYASLTNFDQLSIRTLVVRVQRLPRRPDRLLAQLHPRLLRRPVGLPLVAGHAGQHAVLPARHTTLRPRQHVVHRQFLAARLGTAVLAGVVVPLEDVPAAEGHVGHRQPVVVASARPPPAPAAGTAPPG